MSTDDHAHALREARRASYQKLRAERPHMFVNPPDAPIEIMLDESSQDEAAELAAQAQRDHGLPEEYGEVGVVYEDPYMKLVKDAVRFASGKLGTYIRAAVANNGEPVVVLPVTPDGRIVVARQFRHASREWHWEAPRGYGEPDTDGAANAARELREELGVDAREVMLLGWMDESTDRKVGVYLARISALSEHLGEHAADEGISAARAVTAPELEGMIASGEICDAYTLSAYALARASGALDRLVS